MAILSKLSVILTVSFRDCGSNSVVLVSRYTYNRERERERERERKKILW